MNMDSLALWHLLTGASPDRERCQSALLAIPEASSYTFDADPTATSADLEALEEGASLLLSVQSPAAKAMARNIHDGVEVVSGDLNCCGIFNAKDVRVRMDPVVRMCGLPPKGKGGCTNTSHGIYKLDIKGSRLLIRTPTVSKATTKAFFSLPYLEVEDLPSQAVDLLVTLQAPANVWRTFFTDTPGALKELGVTSGCPKLTVRTSLPGPNELANPDVKPSPLTKGGSPTSYDLIDDMDSLAGEGGEYKETNLEQDDPKSDLLDDVEDIQDLFNLKSDPDLLGDSARALGQKLGDKIQLQSDLLGIARLNLGSNPEDPSVAASSLSYCQTVPDPPSPSLDHAD